MGTGRPKRAIVQIDMVVVSLDHNFVGAVVMMVMMVTFVKAGRQRLEPHVACSHASTNPKTSHAGDRIDRICFALVQARVSRIKRGTGIERTFPFGCSFDPV